MCQLSLLNVGEDLNKLLLATMLQINVTGNRDGTGFLSVREKDIEVWKTEKSADVIGDLGLKIRKKISGNSPVMAHVRSASPGMPVTELNAHPFMGDRFILAHNGRLHRKGAKIQFSSAAEKDAPDIESDSVVFLNALEAYYKTNPGSNFVTAFDSVMKEFVGKFAFLIYDMQTNEHFVVRGNTADLHIADVYTPGTGKTKEPKHIGFIVNTSKRDLLDSLWFASQILQATTGKDIFFSDVTEIEKNSVYKVEGLTLVKLGEVKENAVVYESHTYNQVATGRTQTSPALSQNPVLKYAEAIYRYMVDHFFSYSDIDILLERTTGKPMSEVSESDLEFFVNVWIPRLSASKALRNDIQQIIGEFASIYPFIYTKIPDLQYPWTLNTKDKIKEMLKVLKTIYTRQ
jgi:predicted glutamine amidotransferase